MKSFAENAASQLNLRQDNARRGDPMRQRDRAASLSADMKQTVSLQIANGDALIPTIFHENWWLNACTGGDWQEASVSLDNRIVGRMPYVVQRDWRGLSCDMPVLTHFLGPAIDEGKGGIATRALRQGQITRELLDQIPHTGAFYQKMHAGVKDMLVFQEQHYQVSAQFTHEIAPAAPEILWRAMRDKTRNVIRRANEQLQIDILTDVDEFTRFHDANLALREQKTYYPSPVLKRVCAEAIQRGQGYLLGARDKNGDLSAAIFCITDRRTTYYLVSTRAPQSNNGAVAALIWKAMQRSAESGLIFDFDGISDHTQISRLFFTGFGGEVKPRFTAARASFGHKLRRRFVGAVATGLQSLRLH